MCIVHNVAFYSSMWLAITIIIHHKMASTKYVQTYTIALRQVKHTESDHVNIPCPKTPVWEWECANGKNATEVFTTELAQTDPIAIQCLRSVEGQTLRLPARDCSASSLTCFGCYELTPPTEVGGPGKGRGLYRWRWSPRQGWAGT